MSEISELCYLRKPRLYGEVTKSIMDNGHMGPRRWTDRHTDSEFKTLSENF